MTGNKTALVVGLGRSGKAAARLLRHLGYAVQGHDQKPLDDDPGFPVIGGQGPGVEALDQVDLVVLSPGVPPDPVRAAVAQHAPQARVTGELALGLDVVAAAEGSNPKTVLVTGTNGKSTVTALTGALLQAGGMDTFVGGNLGVPLSEMLTHGLAGDRPWPEAMVLECSSYQLETFEGFPSDVAMILNVTPDHLDRYDSVRDYAATKARIFRGRKEGSLALFGGDATAADAAASAGIGPQFRVDPQRQVGDAELCLRSGAIVPRRRLQIAGSHNAENAIFALEAATHLGVSLHQCERGLSTFTGLPHRMQLVAEIDGVAYYDDSKATNAASVVAGLRGLKRRIVLIAGGRPKGDDLSHLLEQIADAGASLVGIGEAGPTFVDEFERRAKLSPGATATSALSTDMDDAVRKATLFTRPGDAVVLSPGCASFDMYRNYEERGNAFVAAVRKLEP